MNKIEEIFNAKGLNPTAIRIIVLRYLLEQDRAQSLKDIEAALINTERSSIFRALKTFEDHKIVHSIEDGSGMIKYASCDIACNCHPKDLHFHFYCTSCDKTYCLTNSPIPQVKLPENFVMHRANMVIKGLCKSCNQ